MFMSHVIDDVRYVQSKVKHLSLIQHVILALGESLTLSRLFFF